MWIYCEQMILTKYQAMFDFLKKKKNLLKIIYDLLQILGDEA